MEVILFIFNLSEDEIFKIEKTKENCLIEVKKINEEKLNVLHQFFIEIEGKKEQANEIYWNKIAPKMASFGGKNSGQTRLFKNCLIYSILNNLVNHNIDYFKFYTSMNFTVFSKYFLESAPTKTHIIKLINNDLDWIEKNELMPMYARKNSFYEELQKIEYNQNFVDYFKSEYTDFRKKVYGLNEESREKLKEIKDLLNINDNKKEV